LKVGLVIYGSIDTPTGGYLYDRMLVRQLEQEGHEVEVVSQTRHGYLDCIRDNFSVELLGLLRSLDIDVLVEDELNHISLFQLNHALKKQVDYPLVSIVHHLSSCAARERQEREMYAYFEERFLRTMDGFVFNSNATRRTVSRILGREVKGVVAHPGRDHLVPKPRDLDVGKGERLRILYSGNVLPHKGLDILVRSLGLLRSHGIDSFHLSVAGALLDQDFHARITDLVERCDLHDHVEIRGFVSQEEFERLLGESHVMIVPSYYEGYGIVYAEAMGYGMPVIASSAGGAAEMVRDGVDGFLVDPGDYRQLSDRIMILIEQPKLLIDMGANARERFRSLPTWEQSMNRVIEFLLSIQG
jgi:glycosyltransferase involved in cell wall biosynthesis